MSGASAPEPRAYWVLTLLVGVYIFNFVDRNLMTILLNSVKRDLGVSDTAMGFLVGPAFALFYTVAGLPIARLADRMSRRVVISVGLAFWSLMTAASGGVRSFAQMAIARVGVGVGEAAATPAAHSLISDYFPPQRRSTAIAIYNMGASIGMMAGLAFGGFLNDSLGWRAAFVLVGLPGLAMALVVRFALPEPPRGQVEGLADSGDPPRLAEVLRHLLALRSFRHVLASSGLYAITSYAMTTWSPALMERVHKLSPGEFGVQLGMVIGIGGACGALLGGLITDRLGRGDARWMVWVPAIAGIGLLPFLAAFSLWPTPGLALWIFVPANILNQFFPAPSYAVTQGLAKLRMRALASAIILLVINLIGLALGPQLIGVLNDALEPRYGEQAIRYSLTVIGGFNLWAVVHSLLAARTLRQDLQRAAA